MKSRNYRCKDCNTKFDSEEPWHPECPKCTSPNTYGVYTCDLCKSDFMFGLEGLIAIGPQEVLIDDILYQLTFKQWKTCFDCCRKIIADGNSQVVPPKVCNKCYKSCINENGWDGSEVENDATCFGGYGSVAFDMQKHLFKLSPGWYCYPCLDLEVQENRTTLVERNTFVN